MTIENQSLVVDLVTWIEKEPRPYDDVMEAWRTSCPRLSIWEDAVDLGLVQRDQRDNGSVFVSITKNGRDFLTQSRR